MTSEIYNVGGVKLPRPFRTRRLGHVGINCNDIAKSMEFYVNFLGLKHSDNLDFDMVLRRPVQPSGPAHGKFLHHGTEHHSFVLFPQSIIPDFLKMIRSKAIDFPEATTNQITWQVGSLREVSQGDEFFRKQGIFIQRSGRDTPGSNWNVYPIDPDGHVNELFYGMEQVGWDGQSKPMSMHEIFYTAPPPLPHKSELAEVREARAKGLDLQAGTRLNEPELEKYDVGGVLLARPFKIVRVGPVRLFVADIEKATAFYRDMMGMTITEEVTYNGHRCVFLRCNTEHHSMALYPKALRAELGLSPHSTLFSMGFQFPEYSQLRDAVPYLKERGVQIKYLPPELFPGVDYTAFAIDPDGHAIQLYYYMEQVGWDGKPRPANLRRKIDNAKWPEALEPLSDSYLGEQYLGPWG